MARTTGESAADALRDGVPFLAITALWIVVMLALYGGFLLTKPDDLEYTAWIHASVFLPPTIGFLGHVLHQAFEVRRVEG